ncbi:ATPase [Paenibacillus amylolyticus]|uniref:ATPase n=1 Tax=Paenibacillus amylolyticus TaxID=1451 RepID=A0A100VSZ1_PAEAM|nr:ATPase [Paenibacillus amylolyticus]
MREDPKRSIASLVFIILVDHNDYIYEDKAVELKQWFERTIGFLKTQLHQLEYTVTLERRGQK